jgi:formylglycine-generating enzyme required for sulfatase activity
MKSWNRIVPLALLVAAFVVTFAVAQQRGGGFSVGQAPANWYTKSYALVIGIDAYSGGWPALHAAVKDAKRMSAALRAQGFTVTEMFDQQATSSAIINKLREVGGSTDKNGRFVFYFAGHGHSQPAAWDESTEEGFLVPVDATRASNADYISMTQLKSEFLNYVRAKHVLLILDSCFSGSLLQRGAIDTGPVADLLSKRGIYGITAGLADQPAVDGLFTSVLIEGLNGNADADGDGFVSFHELGLYVERNVRARNSRQTPDFGVMYGAGQFVFLRPGPPPPPAAMSGAQATPAATPDLSSYDALVRQEQERQARERSQHETRREAARLTYERVRGIRQNASLSAAAKKKAYRQFLTDCPERADNPYYDEVNGWLNEPEGMVRIEGGTFMMGCSPGDSECYPNESPRHQVTLRPFWMDVTLVTQAEYQRVTGNNPSHFSGCADCPVETVSWNDANNYCSRAGKRLPTEAEYEFAARGGTDTARYGDLDAIAWYGANSGSRTHPVGQKQPNAYGLYDMLGNVWEWTADWYDSNYYQSSPTNNPQGPSSGTARVLRGGGWGNNPGYYRASDRGGTGPDVTFANLGFRCSRD